MFSRDASMKHGDPRSRQQLPEKIYVICDNRPEEGKGISGDVRAKSGTYSFTLFGGSLDS